MEWWLLERVWKRRKIFKSIFKNKINQHRILYTERRKRSMTGFCKEFRSRFNWEANRRFSVSSQVDWCPRLYRCVPYAHRLTFPPGSIYSYCKVKCRIQWVSNIRWSCRPNSSEQVLNEKSSSQTTCKVAKTSRAVALNVVDSTLLMIQSNKYLPPDINTMNSSNLWYRFHNRFYQLLCINTRWNSFNKNMTEGPNNWYCFDCLIKTRSYFNNSIS